MTRVEKELRIKDLYARLPYGVFVEENRTKLDPDPVIYTYDYHPYIDNCKPYLRPMESMTEEELKEFYIIEDLGEHPVVWNKPQYNWKFTVNGIDWLNKKGFDYRGLIPMGLALEAPEDMYK